MKTIVHFWRSIMLMAILCVLSGCRDALPSVTKETLVGSYSYVSNDPENRATDHEWERLALRADGKYDLVQGGPTKAKSETTGFWYFSGGDHAQVLLDHAGYPVRVTRGEVRLLIDDDVGIWYAKAK